MKTSIVYFTIKGRTEEALNFYKNCFGGEITFLQRFSETKYKVSKEYENKIAHAEFKAENIHFYISDGFEKEDIIIGGGIGVTVNFDNLDEQKCVFEKLKEEGKVTFDFFETSIETKLVSLVDKFGIPWYLNYEG
ncbi:VOC family protein [Weeksellaceae bacterium TAE3-ERU29]|nr:VOC family protein [Weeksellaceae bacterium TAE3-ERU29]